MTTFFSAVGSRRETSTPFWSRRVKSGATSPTASGEMVDEAMRPSCQPEPDRPASGASAFDKPAGARRPRRRGARPSAADLGAWGDEPVGAPPGGRVEGAGRVQPGGHRGLVDLAG